MRKRRKEFNSILAPIKPQFAGMKPAVFLDRDGTLIAERNYLRRPEDVVIFPGAAAASEAAGATPDSSCSSSPTSPASGAATSRLRMWSA